MAYVRFDLATFIPYAIFIFLIMRKLLNLTFVLLLLFTFTTACIANTFVVSAFVVPLIMVLAAFKFLLVAFQFMELKKAHVFWKVGLVVTLGLLVVLIVGLK